MTEEAAPYRAAFYFCRARWQAPTVYCQLKPVYTHAAGQTNQRNFQHAQQTHDHDDGIAA